MLAGKRILFVTHRFPYPPAGGAKVRAFHCIRHLAARNEVTVAAPTRTSEEADAVAGLEAQGVRVISQRISKPAAALRVALNAAFGRPASMGFFRSPGVVRAIGRYLAQHNPDLIVVHCSSVAPYVAAAGGVPKALDFVDMDSQKWLDYRQFHGFPLSLAYLWEGMTLARAEARLAKAFDLCLVTTHFERETLETIAGPVPTAVIRNGVDLDFFAPSAERHDRDLICFVGRMDYYPNEQAMVVFAGQALPLIRQRRPDAKLKIVGAEPTAAVRALERIPGVEVTGTVDDVRPHVRSAALTVAPLSIARGTQNKVLESMAMGVPVVASPLAARGVDAAAGEHLLVAEGPQDTAEKCLAILEDPKLREKLAAAGRARVESLYPWEKTLAEFDAALVGLMER